VALNQSANVNENGSFNLLLDATDIETARANLTFELVNGPAHGSITQGAGGAWVYTPTAGYVGADSFTWRVKASLHLSTELMMQLRSEAESEAIKIFARNLRELLLAAPAGPKAVLGLDPGLRTGCKVAVVDAT
jgi:L-serine deaminase